MVVAAVGVEVASEAEPLAGAEAVAVAEAEPVTGAEALIGQLLSDIHSYLLYYSK